MSTKKEGDVKMVVLTQKDIERRVSNNSRKFKNTIGRVTSEIQSQNLRKGRVRPRDPVEAMILSKFKK